MSPLELLVLLFSIHTLASPVAIPSAKSFTFDGDAPFSVDTATLAAALTCPDGNPTKDSPPVLLVHGTACTGEQTWAEGYVPALRANGYTACYVTIPGRSMNDMQLSSEFIAYNLHQISHLSGGLKTAVIAHSQGNPDTQWALQFWPSTQSVTRAFVALSPDFRGIHLGDTSLSAVCGSGLCEASLWQQSAGSKYYDALHRKNFEAQVPTTVVWSHFDEVVLPAEDNAQLPNANVISVQDLCPLRVVDHVFMTIDSAGFSIALDALNHNGIASVARLKKHALGICFRIAAKKMKITVAAQLQADWDDLVNGFITAPKTKLEPTIKAYALS